MEQNIQDMTKHLREMVRKEIAALDCGYEKKALGYEFLEAWDKWAKAAHTDRPKWPMIWCILLFPIWLYVLLKWDKKVDALYEDLEKKQLRWQSVNSNAIFTTKEANENSVQTT